MRRETHICPDCWATVTVEYDGADITYSANGSSITIHKEGAESLLGRLKWASTDRIFEKAFPPESKCPACKPFTIIP